MTDPRPDDWSDLAEVWTAPDAETPPTADLVRRMRRRALLARVNFHLEAWGAVIAGLIGGGFALRHDSLLVGGAALVFSGFSLLLTLWARRGAEPGAAATPTAALEAATRQARSGLRWARAGQAVSAAAFAFLAVIAVDRGVAGMEEIYLACAGFLVVCLGLYERHARRCRRRMADHAAALAALDGPA